MQDKLKKLIQQRVNEARKKDISDKTVRILKSFGTPIRYDGFDFNDGTSGFVWDVGDESAESIPEIGDNASTIIGYSYDFLKIGKNLCIVQDMLTGELKITLDGNLKYHEINGDIKCYVPSDDWEKTLDAQFALTKRKESVLKKEDKQAEKIEWEREKSFITDFLSKVWGYKF